MLLLLLKVLNLGGTVCWAIWWTLIWAVVWRMVHTMVSFCWSREVIGLHESILLMIVFQQIPKLLSYLLILLLHLIYTSIV